MNKAVALVNEWGKFDAQHPNGSIEDFCRHYLLHRSEKESSSWLSGKWPLPVSVDFALLRLTGRIVKLHTLYASMALEGTGISTLDEFSLLNAIQSLKEPRKTEAIYKALFELSTGTDMINRLKKIGFLSEQEDAEDRRSKRIKTTAKGQKALAAGRKQVEKLAEMEFYELSSDEKKLCIQLLAKVDEKFSELWLSHKGKDFDGIYKEMVPAQQ